MLNGLRQRYRDAMTNRVEHNSTGFRIIKGRGMLRAPEVTARNWAGISGVTVFKMDVYTTDRITLLFEGSSPLLAVDETMEGYKELVDHLPQYLPGFKPFEDWFLTVAFPAFAPNPTVIYRRG